MKLFYTPRSPFVRKTRAAIIELGMKGDIEEVEVNLENPPAELFDWNPLGKVPTLMADGRGLFGSQVICEYLDSLGGKMKLFPAAGHERWTALRQQSLADGIMEQLSARRHEEKRPEEQRSAKAITKMKGKSDRGLTLLEKEVATLGAGEGVTIGQLAVAACLGYCDFRFSSEPWREQYKGLANWYESFSQRPSIRQTMPPKE